MITSTYIGVDIGTQGVRVMWMDQRGNSLITVKEDFGWTDNRNEQDPALWWRSLVRALRKLRKVSSRDDLNRIRAIAVTSTSGTVIPMNRSCVPLHRALMYSDNRSTEEASFCTAVSGKPFNASYGLPKMLWYIRHYPKQANLIHLWCHAADYITGMLSGVWGITDPTSALKSGYDPVNERWPDYIATGLNIPLDQLPKVVASGTVIGRLSAQASEETGLPASIQVVTGMTDGCASQVASGCAKPGQWNTTIGTTLVVKGITTRPVHDPAGRIYNHKHPDGYWMPGGASNTGADWISRDFGNLDLRQLEMRARQWLPTPWLSYALTQTGERFPFLNPHARGFDAPGLTDEQIYASRLESVAYIERLSYETIEALSDENVNEIYTAGGGSSSDLWLQIRSDVLRRPIMKMKHVEGSVGAAMLAASAIEFSSLEEAVQQMSIIDKRVEPGNWQEQYEEQYEKFKDLLAEKGYIDSKDAQRTGGGA